MLPIYICEDDAQIRSICEEYIRKQILIEDYDMELHWQADARKRCLISKNVRGGLLDKIRCRGDGHKEE